MNNNLEFCYDKDDLGLTYTKEESVFKVWAPTAVQVFTVIYQDAGEYDEYGYVKSHTGGKAYEMYKEDGIWQVRIPGNLDGLFYMYEVRFDDNKTYYKVDPYAVSVSANGQRGAIIDLNKTNPKDWDIYKYKQNKKPTDAVIMELHVRDFSHNKAVNFKYPGKFKAFTELGLKTPEGNLVGIDSLEELGITHVQLQPIFDYAFLNELKSDDDTYSGRKYNWGYDPANYNVPEGSYATNPSNPYVRVSEMKEMVAALHKKNIGVIMDVVYNHTFSIQNGPFQHIVPDYFYRKKSDGSFAEGSGCKNEIATQRPMVRKYILDSLKYWITEYGIDGFRFDLMGLIDVDTMEYISAKLRYEVRDDIIIYGEPWQAGGSVLPKAYQTLKGAQKGLAFAVFNDNFRNAIKGSNTGEVGAFAVGERDFEADIAEGVCGSIHTFTANPTETINYVTAHDDLNLWDKMVTSYKISDKEGFLHLDNGLLLNNGNIQEAVANATVHHDVIIGKVLKNDCVRSCLLANAVIMTSQGIPFFHAGDEFLRSKYGDFNSYRSPDCINEIRWQDKDKYMKVFRYYQGMIALRKAHPAFRMTISSKVEKQLFIYQKSDGVVCFGLKEWANGDPWRHIVVIYNNNKEEKIVKLPEDTKWNIVMNAEEAGCKVLESLNSNMVKIDKISAMVLFAD